MYKILITGSKGQLGQQLMKQASQLKDAEFIFTDVEELDICDEDAVANFVGEQQITHVVNCAAYTAVDNAEEDEEKAFAINQEAVANLAMAVEKNNAMLIHISTDYVFDGEATLPYSESDETHPLSVYGKSKLAGEKEIMDRCRQAIIIRTAWLYSAKGKNFLNTMQRLGSQKGEISVVADQLGTPTNAADLAAAILEIIPQLEDWREGVQLYHYANEGMCSWFDFAQEIMDISNLECKVNPITTEEYPTAAQRPTYSVLDKTKIKQQFGLLIRPWQDSLQAAILEQKQSI